jgi:uncharacterized protein with von Willebrand factor type A (vWA) domain
MTLVKDEAHFDKFDRAFGLYFKGIQAAFEQNGTIPLDWLVQRMKRELSPSSARRWKIRLRQADGPPAGTAQGTEGTPRRRQQMDRHGRHLAVRPRRHQSRRHPHRRQGRQPHAVKVWEARNYKDYDGEREIGTRNIKVALRRAQVRAQGAAEELALDDTIRATASNAGYLDIKMQPERKNNIKVLMLFDVGGTMDDHIERTEELFSAAKQRVQEHGVLLLPQLRVRLPVEEQPAPPRRTFPDLGHPAQIPPDTKLIFVGDATMSPYEILQPGGSVEYNNEEAGAVWLQRFTAAFPKFVWLNPEPEGVWQYRQSIGIIAS